jgi:Domain of unknown function (DUF4397)
MFTTDCPIALEPSPRKHRFHGLKAALAGLLAAAVLAACGGGGGDTAATTAAPSSAPSAAAAQVRTVNAMDDASVATLSIGSRTINLADVDEPVSEFVDMAGNGLDDTSASVAVAPEKARASANGTAARETAAGSSSAISVAMEAAPGEKITVIATGNSNSVQTLSVKQSNAAIPADKTGVRVLHAAQQVPAVDIYVSAPDVVLPATPTIAGLKFTQFAPARDQSSLQVPKGDYQIRVTEAGKTDVVFDSGKLTLPGGQDVLIAAIPTFVPGALINLLLLPTDGKPVVIKEPRTSLRAVHLSSDAPAVDVLLDGQRVVRGLMFREDTSFLKVAAGKVGVKVNAANTATSVIDANVDLPANKAVSVVALDKLAAIQAAVIVDDGQAPAAGKGKLRVLHAATGVPAVDVYLSAPEAALPADAAIKGIEFKSAVPASGAAALEIAAGSYRVRLTLEGKKDVVYDSGPFKVKARDDLIAAAVLPKVGSPAQPSPVDLLVVRTRGGNSLLKSVGGSTPPPPPVGSVTLRAVHASPEAPSVDVLVDGAVAIAKLSFGELSDRKAVVEGERDVKVNLAGTATTVRSENLNLQKNLNYSVVAYNTPTALKALLLVDSTQIVFAGARGYIRIANLITDTVGPAEFTGASTGSPGFGVEAPYGETSLGSKSVGVKYATASGSGAASVGFELESGNFYTVYAIGSADTSKGKPVRLIVSRDSKP